MEQRIQSTLKEIAERHNIKILLACETGSRAWGFPSPDSDYDVRMIYKHNVDHYLSLNEKKDTIEFMSEDGELDVTGWDIKKSLKLMWKSNGALLERLQSPIVYQEEKNSRVILKEQAYEIFSPIASMYHYLGMAKMSFADVEGKEEVKLKKLFYALRATLACKWITDKNSPPPIVFITMVDELAFDEQLKSRIKELIEYKSGKNESYIHPAEKKLNDFLKEEIEKAEKTAPTLASNKNKEADLDELFRKIVKSN